MMTPNILQMPLAQRVGCGEITDVGESLGDFLRRVRKQKGLSQSAFGARIGVDGQTISNIEGGRTKTLKLKHLQRLPEVTGTPIEEITAMVPDAVPATVVLEISREAWEFAVLKAGEKGMTVEAWFEERAWGGTAIVRQPIGPVAVDSKPHELPQPQQHQSPGGKARK